MRQLNATLLLVFVAGMVNLSGVWTGAFRGGDQEIPQLITLKQQGSKVTGTGGPDSTEQYPVLNGAVSGNVVKFEVDNAQRKFFYILKGTDSRLRGSLTIKSGNDTRTTTVWLDRAH